MSRTPGAFALTSLFSAETKPRADDERLLDLYWNRAQLKKEFAAMRKERFTLLDTLTKQEGKSARLSQKLEYLEDLLADEESANNTIAYYSLRKLWTACSNRLVSLAAELKRQREAQATIDLRENWKQKMQRSISDVAARLKSLNKEVQSYDSQVHTLSEQLVEAQGIFKYFRRRALTEELDTLYASMHELNDLREREQESLNRLRSEKVPEFETLSLEARRGINCTVLALGELLAEHYAGHGLLDMAQSTLEKSVGSTRYGTPKECAKLVQRIQERQRQFEKAEREKDFTKKLASRAKSIRKAAAYNKSVDAIPTPGCMNDSQINVLAKDIWSISGAMIL